MRVLIRRIARLYSLLALMLLAACSSGGSAGQAPTPTLIPAPQVSEKPTYEVQRGEVVRYFEFPARVMPVEQVELFFRVDGRVRNVYVDRGDRVKAGDVLADLENLQDLEVQRTFDQLSLRRAEIALEVAQRNLAFTLETVPVWADDYQYRVDLDEYNVELAQIELDEMTLRMQDLDASIADAQLIAPMDGVVITMNVKEGTPITAYEGMMLIADTSALELGAELTDTQMSTLTEGTSVIISRSSEPGTEMTGVIRSLPYPYGGGAEDDIQPVRITVEGGIDFDLNSNATVTIILEQHSDVLWLPPEAIRIFERRKFVVIQDGDIQRRIDIETGIEGEDRIEIVAGLTEGQIVIGP
jgi:membrane fusion protein, macrolide-specific efflux system